MPRLLLLIPTTTYRARPFVDAARALGVDLIVASEEPSALQETSPDNLLTLRFDDALQAAEDIARFTRERPLDAVVGVDERSTVVASAIAERLRLPAHPAAASRAARDKGRMRALLREAGVPSPRHELIKIDSEPREHTCRAYPCVLKPTGLSGSRGVIRADNPEEFAAAFKRIRALLRRPDVAAACEDAGHILAEEFVPGPEVALEGVMEKGKLRTLALFDKPDPLDGPFFEETIYVTPSRLSAAAQSGVADRAERAARALGLNEGPVHAELRLSDAGPVVIEVAARSIGGLCSRVLRFGAGITLEELILRHALGLDLSFFERERRPAGVMMLPIQRGGAFRQARNIEAAKAVPGIEDIVITTHTGRVIEPLPEGGEYLGFLFARADTPFIVEQALRQAHALLDIVIE